MYKGRRASQGLTFQVNSQGLMRQQPTCFFKNASTHRVQTEVRTYPAQSVHAPSTWLSDQTCQEKTNKMGQAPSTYVMFPKTPLTPFIELRRGLPAFLARRDPSRRLSNMDPGRWPGSLWSGLLSGCLRSITCHQRRMAST
jgi:hypothetical protein